MRTPLTKAELKRQRDQLALYERFLPSLDLKRQQLLLAHKRARDRAAALETELDEVLASLEQLFLLLGSSTLPAQSLSRLVSVERVDTTQENVVGVRLPVVKEVRFARVRYSALALPFWVDRLVAALVRVGELRVRIRVEHERVEMLAGAVRRITQRVNLFEKILIPRARALIKQIAVAISDQERSAVIRSKLAKRRHLAS